MKNLLVLAAVSTLALTAAASASPNRGQELARQYASYQAPRTTQAYALTGERQAELRRVEVAKLQRYDLVIHGGRGAN